MVAYSFNKIFAHQVERLAKLQTVRADRKRHARPGEPVQLFTGMRTRQCRKLVLVDPICASVRRIEIETVHGNIASISVDGIALDANGIEFFAAADGFDPRYFGAWRGAYLGRADLRAATARSNMADFWEAHHGLGRFEGVLIEWMPS